jgi:DNA-binding transcriptional ArsR family regulator
MDSSLDDHPPDDLDRVWAALANPWRRRILDALREGPLSSGEVVERLDSGRHLVLQHLAVLRESGLVITEKDGRRRINHLNPVPIRLIYQRWVSRYEGAWAEALTGLKADIEDNWKEDHG